MTEPQPLTFTEDRIPAAGIEKSIEELVELYGGEIVADHEPARREFTIPFRRGVASSGFVKCSIAWTTDPNSEATVSLTCDRDVDAPKAQRVMMLIVGVAGSLLFLLWPFFPTYERQMGTLAWLGGAVAIAVYILSLRRTSGGLGLDFLQRLAAVQRSHAEENDGDAAATTSP